MAEHEPAEGDEYRNKNTIPGYGPGLLTIELLGVEPENGIVRFKTIESNRLRSGPFVGIEGILSMQALENDYEYLFVSEVGETTDEGITYEDRTPEEIIRDARDSYSGAEQ